PARLAASAASVASCGWTRDAIVAYWSGLGKVLPASQRTAVRCEAPTAGPNSRWVMLKALRTLPSKTDSRRDAPIARPLAHIEPQAKPLAHRRTQTAETMASRTAVLVPPVPRVAPRDERGM